MKLKLLKYPRKPKMNASLAVMERYLKRRQEVDRENARRKSDAKKRETLREKIRRI
ncbi:MAG: hypothetical protein AB2L13_20990 [Spirochaetota bacterium]